MYVVVCLLSCASKFVFASSYMKSIRLDDAMIMIVMGRWLLLSR